ncbi:MAG TPA: 3-isopropylmalate dehydratase large subunit [Ruminococcaceae bacterium]|nr:3-isopropylmalate dehydratase large subunit [Oscillospiraceae bacterium]
MAMTMTQKILAAHCGQTEVTSGDLIFADADLIMGNDITASAAIAEFNRSAVKTADPSRIVMVMDHFVPNKDIKAAEQCKTCRSFCREQGIDKFYDVGDMGIEHTLLPDKGLVTAGDLVIGADSHTCTYGALGAFSTGVGSTDMAYAMASGRVWFKVPGAIRFILHGAFQPFVSGKDLILHIIGKIGVDGALYRSMEFVGDGVKSLEMCDRFTVCNMAIEAGARAGLVAVDQTTIDYVKGRPYAPKGDQWDKAVAYWNTLHSDPDASFDVTVELDAAEIKPQVTWGTSPEMVVSIEDKVPNPADEKDPVRRDAMVRALKYIGLEAGTPMEEIAIDKVFIGSCTNGRIEDMRAAAAVVKGKKRAPNVKQALVVPGSGLVKEQAEQEGLDKIFIEAGFEWREAGCSMCLAMNDDRLAPGERCASTSNRNFEGRQGQNSRTHLVSPAMAAAAGIAGHFVDVRKL